MRMNVGPQDTIGLTFLKSRGYVVLFHIWMRDVECHSNGDDPLMNKGDGGGKV